MASSSNTTRKPMRESTRAGKHKGSGFAGEIKLADFVDLETGEFV